MSKKKALEKSHLLQGAALRSTPPFLVRPGRGGKGPLFERAGRRGKNKRGKNGATNDRGASIPI